jgi:hypothetical protein
MELTGKERRELKRLIMNKYPITKAESQCANERKMMADVRDSYKRELLKWYSEKGTFNGYVSRVDLIIQKLALKTNN